MTVKYRSRLDTDDRFKEVFYNVSMNQIIITAAMLVAGKLTSKPKSFTKVNFITDMDQDEKAKANTQPKNFHRYSISTILLCKGRLIIVKLSNSDLNL